ncbi:sensor histidine kinase [Streptomyces sp. NPDC001663]|uniref:sensor histidine kinase n=1 Tax=Streptomyces sp. NPDC001663 TaxID=3364597 RepID=UPI0036C9D1A8
MATSPGATVPYPLGLADTADGVRGTRRATVSALVATAVAVVTAGASYAVGNGGELGPFGVYAPPVWALPTLFAAAALAVTGVWATRGRQPAASSGLALAVAAALLPFWAGWDWLPASARSALLATSPFVVAGLARAVVRLSPRPATRAVRRGLCAVFVFAGAAALVHLLGYNPFADPGCARVCQDVRPFLDGTLAPRTAVLLTGVLTSCAAVAALATVAGSGVPGVPRTAVAAGLVALGTSAATAWQGTRWGEPASPARQLAQPVAVALLASVLCAAAVRTTAARVDLGRLAHRLSGPEAAVTGVGAGVRGVHFAMPGTPEDQLRWIDVSGREVAAEAPDRPVVLADDTGRPVLRLLLARHADADDALAGLAPTTRLALGNARLSAVLRARLAEIRASQRRVVAASDAERRRLERDLHDGVQQRLVSAALHLKVAASAMAPAQALALADAEVAVRDALAQLRRVAHGSFPGVLADEGLDAGLEDLAAACEIPVTVDSRTRIEGDTDAAPAAYAVVAAALESAARRPRADHVAVSAVGADGTLTVRVAITASGTARRPGADDLALTDAADRVGATGGEFTVAGTSRDGVVVTTLTAVIPCRS